MADDSRRRLLLPVVLASIGLGLVAWSLLRQPRIATRVEPGAASVPLRVQSRPSGASLAVRMHPPAEPVQVAIADTVISTGIAQGDWQVIGPTPVTGIRLPVQNRLVVSADHAWWRSDEQVIRHLPVAYDLRLSLDGHQERLIEGWRPDPAATEPLVVVLEPRLAGSAE